MMNEAELKILPSVATGKQGRRISTEEYAKGGTDSESYQEAAIQTGKVIGFQCAIDKLKMLGVT